MLNKLKKVKGFTLIELIIVIAIIAILAAIAVPAFGQIRQKANVSSDLGNARTIYSLVATELASGNINDNLSVTDIDNLTLIDGVKFSTKIEPTPIVKTYQQAKFAITIVDGNIQVYAHNGDVTGSFDPDGSGSLPVITKVEAIYPTNTGKYGSN